MAKTEHLVSINVQSWAKPTFKCNLQPYKLVLLASRLYSAVSMLLCVKFELHGVENGGSSPQGLGNNRRRRRRMASVGCGSRETAERLHPTMSLTAFGGNSTRIYRSHHSHPLRKDMLFIRLIVVQHPWIS